MIEKNMNPQNTKACISPGQNRCEITFFCSTNSTITLFIRVPKESNSNEPVPLDTMTNLLKISYEKDPTDNRSITNNDICSIVLNVMWVIYSSSINFGSISNISPKTA